MLPTPPRLKMVAGPASFSRTSARSPSTARGRRGSEISWRRAGVAADSNDGFSNSADVGKAYSESGAAAACICGTDETYAQLVEATAGALKAAGAAKVYVAGRPGDDEPAVRAAGVDGFLYHGMNVIEALANLQEDLGVAR